MEDSMNDDALIGRMFDEVISTEIRENGTVEQKRRLTDDLLKGEVMSDACDKLIAAHRKFEKLDGDPRKYYEPALNLAWWHAMNKLAECERKVWRLFVGGHPTLQSNVQYAQWRKTYLEGKQIKVDA